MENAFLVKSFKSSINWNVMFYYKKIYTHRKHRLKNMKQTSYRPFRLTPPGHWTQVAVLPERMKLHIAFFILTEHCVQLRYEFDVNDKNDNVLFEI